MATLWAETVRSEDEEDPKVFVLSLCDGIAAAYVAVSAWTTRICGWSCERMPHLRECVQGQWPMLSTSALGHREGDR